MVFPLKQKVRKHQVTQANITEGELEQGICTGQRMPCTVLLRGPKRAFMVENPGGLDLSQVVKIHIPAHGPLIQCPEDTASLLDYSCPQCIV